MALYEYPSPRKFEKIFLEKVGFLLIDNGFDYTKKFHCYYRYISENILQIFSNRIYDFGLQWEDYVGVYPLCEPNDVLIGKRLSWRSFYLKQFETEMRTAFWISLSSEECENLLNEELCIGMHERLDRCRKTLEEHIIPRLNEIVSFTDYLSFIQKMPQYTSVKQTMGPLLGRYGSIPEIESRLEEYIKEEAATPQYMKKWRLAEVEQYQRIKNQRLQQGPESFEPLLRKYVEATRARLDEEMAAPLPQLREV